jgi:hypothetical protein
MNTIRGFAVAAALVLLSASSLGQQPRQGTAPAPPAATQAPPAASPPAPAASPPPTEQRGVVKDDEFIPSQDISPDEGVTFPVGI